MADDALSRTAVQNENQIEFPNNRLLAKLCGEYDRNLTTIETELFIQIVRRGNQLVLIGDEESLSSGVSILQYLYNRLEQGRDVLPVDIVTALRMNSVTNGGKKNTEQLKMFKGSTVEIKTRKKIVEPRTEAQAIYVESLFNNELAFGIGPAVALGLYLIGKTFN